MYPTARASLTFAQSAEVLAMLVKRYGSESGTFAVEYERLVATTTRFDSHPLYGGATDNLDHVLEPDRPLFTDAGSLAITMAQLQWRAEKVQPERDLNDWRLLTSSERYMVE